MHFYIISEHEDIENINSRVGPKRSQHPLVIALMTYDAQSIRAPILI